MPPEPSLDPDLIPDTEFATGFRGYDTNEVRAFLVRVADAVRSATARERELAQQLEYANERIAELEGEIEAARAHAAEEGLERGRQMVAEARTVRERMLKDLARRRRHARIQVEQLMAGRDRLLESFAVTKQILDEAAEGMSLALPEARLAAEAVGRAAPPEDDEDAVEALEAHIDEARAAGLDLGEDRSEPQPAPKPMEKVLTERELGEMPEVHPGEDFEEVRIVDEDEDEAEADEPEPEATQGESESEPEPEPEPESESESDPEPTVDDLFARLRESRAEVGSGPEQGDAEPTQGDSAPEATQGEAAGSPHQAREEALAGPTQDLIRSFKRVLADEQNEVLDALRRRKRNQELDPDDVIGTRTAVVAAWAEAATGPLEDAARAGAEGGDPPDVSDLAKSVAKALGAALRDRVASAIADAGDDTPGATQRVRATFREWKTQRVDEAADHYARAAYGAGAFAAVPEGVIVKWVIDPAGSNCPDCEDNALAGDITRGNEFPTGHRHPPAHDGCKCALSPQA